LSPRLNDRIGPLIPTDWGSVPADGYGVHVSPMRRFLATTGRGMNDWIERVCKHGRMPHFCWPTLSRVRSQTRVRWCRSNWIHHRSGDAFHFGSAGWAIHRRSHSSLQPSRDRNSARIRVGLGSFILSPDRFWCPRTHQFGRISRKMRPSPSAHR
jgi:hypothetical protein